jgi:hypothetical protein
LDQAANEIDEHLRLWPDDFLVRDDGDDMVRRKLELQRRANEPT